MADYREARELLNSINKLNRQIENKIAEIEALKAQSVRLYQQAENDPVQSSAKTGFAEVVDRIIDETTRKNAMLQALIDQKNKVVAIVERVEDAIAYDLLCKRYIECKSWPQVSTEMYLSCEYVRGALNKSALQIVQEIIYTSKKDTE